MIRCAAHTPLAERRCRKDAVVNAMVSISKSWLNERAPGWVTVPLCRHHANLLEVPAPGVE